MHMRTVAAATCLLIASTATVWAQPAESGHMWQEGFPADPYYVASPDQIVRQGLDRMTGFLMGSPDTSPAALREFLELQVAPYFDFPYMARWAAGPLHHRLTPGQRAALGARLKAMFLDALARHLGTVERPVPAVDVFPARPGSTLSEARVYALVHRVQGAPVRLEFRFYWGRGGWRIYDALANGASAVAFYRRYFTTKLRREGPDTLLR
jgi:phospholipid transport system substrate-binding protein